MIRSTLLVSAGLAVTAVVLAALWIGYGPRPQPDGPDKRVSTVVPLSRQQRSGLDVRGQAIRTISPDSNPAAGMATAAPAGPVPPAVEPGPSGTQEDGRPNPGLRTDTAPGGVGDPSPIAGGTVDLNTASVEQLNALGAGMIGRRIIEFRPYASPDELVARRVLKRADYEAIKNAVTVR